MKLFIGMKSILSKWRSYLLSESLAEYSQDGSISLYHYSKTNEPSLVLDPDRFLEHNTYTRNDFNASSLPRVFFYVNLDHAEPIVKEGATLYTTTVSVNDIYDMRSDELGLKQKAMRYPGIAASIDFDWMLRSIAGAIPENWSSKSILPEGTPPYKGAYYTLSNMDVVVWFDKLEVTKASRED
mgnify:FL=1